MEIATESSYLTIRLLMQGKEVGSIIGKKGDNIKAIREESNARITISDGSTTERIVTINGHINCTHTAFYMICKKFEEDLKQTCTVSSIPPITLRLIVPASQCGSIIGKAGCKIKEIREATGANIQVASEMLPNSTERAVTLSGKFDSISNCFKIISNIMLDSPAKGDTLPYKPRSNQTLSATSTASQPIVYAANGLAYQIHGQYAIPLPHYEVAKLLSLSSMSAMNPFQATNALQNNMLSIPNGSPRSTNHNLQTQEMNIPNDLIGCIIGRGGQKISEIRQTSGANIKIGDMEDGNPGRHVCITGTSEQIQLAQFLINTRIAVELGGLILPQQVNASGL